MKRSIFWIAAVLFLAAGFLSSCKDDDKNKDSVVAVKSVTFTRSTVALPLGDEDKAGTVALAYTLEPAKANNIESVTWSSNASGVATVSQSGLVTSVELGEATITVTVKTTDGGAFTSKCTVKVVPAPIGVVGIEFEDEEIALAPGGSITLTPVFSPEDADNQTVTWESDNEEVATVDKDGVVTAVDIGTAVITATTEEGRYKARCTIIVRIDVTGVEFEDGSDLVLEAGDIVTLIANVLPEDATNQNVTWESSDTDVATVDKNGNVTATGVGTATITVTTAEGEFEASLDIEVLTTAVTGIELEDNAKISIDVGSEITLKAYFLPDNATNKKVEWESSDPTVASVDENGKVTAIDVGTAIITVTTDEGGFQDSREIEVTKINVTGVHIQDFPPSAMRKFEEIDFAFTLTAVVEPSDATIRTVTWESSDTDVAEVNENGKLVIKSPGKVTITATTTDGGFKSTFVISPTYYSLLDRSKWSFPGYADNSQAGQVGYDSQANNEGGSPNGRVIAMLDGDSGTFWHARWGENNGDGLGGTDYPHWFIVDLGEDTEFSAVMLQRRQGNGGTAKGYQVYTSNVMNPPGSATWTDRGEYDFDPGINDKQAKALSGGTVKARYILMYFDDKYKGSGNYTMFAEFGLYKRE